MAGPKMERQQTNAEVVTETWADQEAELQELRNAIFPRETKFPFQQAFPGANGWAPSKEGVEEVVEAGFFGEALRTPRLYERDKAQVKRIILGRPKSKDDVTEKKTIIRFFVSSTFTDTKWERDAFIAFCVPYLQQISRLRNLEFCLSEMRWGINDGLSQSHQTSTVCMNELKRCVDESAGLQFVGILGNKYGYRPFPAEIEKSLFEKMMKVVPKPDLFKTWFQVDKNRVPNVYVLRPVKDVIPSYNPNVFNKYAKTWWSECFEPMQAMLRKAAQDLAKTDKAVEKEAINYIQSVTEDEMHRGFNGKNETLLIIRELETENGAAIEDRRFTDGNDEDARTRLNALKAEMSSKAAKTGPVIRYTVPWKEGGLDPRENAEHAEYLRNVLIDWTRAAEKSINQIKVLEHDALFEEAQEHCRFAVTKARDFIGRDDLIKSVKGAVQAGRGVVIKGLSGSGKTSLLSRITLTELNPKAAVVLRFLGTTLSSKTSVTLLSSLCTQISRIYLDQDPEDLPADFHTLVTLFHSEYLGMATASQPLVLVLDSLDQLADAENLSWLPHNDTIPPNVKIIVSTLPYLYDSVVHTKQYQSVIEVNPIGANDVKSVLDLWLKSKKRDLTQAQRNAVLEVIGRAESPTYLLLRILFNEALLWRSYTPVPESWANIKDVPSAIDALFDRLEEEHGKTFVTAGLSLLTASRDGLSGNELEDLLSLNDAVLKECFQWWVPVVARVPPLLVTRLLGSLGDYVVTQNNTWFHRQFREAAMRRYDSTYSVQQIANYFAETTQVEPYMIHEKGRHHVRLSTDRRIQTQPIMLGNGTFNERKLRELPAALMSTGRYTECMNLLKDPVFCRGMFALGLGQELIDLTRDHRLPEPTFRKYYHRALNQCRDDVVRDLNLLEEQLWGRLVPVLGDDDPFIRMLQSHRMKHPGLHARFSNVLNAANSPLITTIRGHTAAVESICDLELADGKRLMITGSKDQSVKVWNIDSSSLDKTLIFNSHVTCVCAAPQPKKNPVLVVCLMDASFQFFDSESWQQIRVVEGNQGDGHGASVNSCCYVHGPNNEGYVVTASSDSTCKVWDLQTGKLRHTLKEHFEPVNSICSLTMRGNRGLVVSGSDDRSLAFFTASDGFSTAKVIGNAHDGAIYAVAGVNLADQRRVVVSGSFDRSAKIWDAETYETLAVIQHEASVTAACGIRLIDGRGLLVTGSADNTLCVFDPQGNRELVKLTGHSNSIHALSSLHTNDGRYLLASGSFDCDIKLWEVGVDSEPKSPGSPKTPIEAPRPSFSSHSRGVTALCKAPGPGKLLLVASGSEDTTLKLWEATSGAPFCTLECHSLGICAVRAVTTKSGRSIVVTGGKDELIGLFDTEKRSHFNTLNGFSGHANTLQVVEEESLLLYPDENVIKVFDLEKQVPVCDLTGHKDQVRAINYFRTKDGSTLVLSGSGKPNVSSGSDFSVKVFKIATKDLVKSFEGHKGKVNGVCGMDLGGGMIAIASCSDDRTVRLWDLQTGSNKSVLEGHLTAVEAVYPIHHTMRPLLVSGARNDNVRVWDVVSGSMLFALPSIPGAEPWQATCVVPFQGGKHLVVCATREKTVDVLDPSSGKLVSSTGFPGTSPLSVSSIADGVIAVGTSNGRITIFDVAV